jgi:hypothetical protein
VSRLALRISLLSFATIVSACGSEKSPTSPSTPAPTTPTTVSLSGTVFAQGGARLGGASIRMVDGINVGKTTTANANGDYRFDGLTPGNDNLAAHADGFEDAVNGLTIDGTKALNFTLRTAVAWSKTGVGVSVFDMPTYITRVHIIGIYTSSCQNFIVHIGGRGVVNEILGTCSIAIGPRYEGTSVTTGGTVEVLNASGVSWSFVEER